MSKEEGRTRKRSGRTRFRELIADAPEQLLKLVEGLFGQSFYFRGHADVEWKLATTLERTYDDITSYREEHRILSEFQRRAGAFAGDLPPENDQIEWMALLRHFGGPTRLLDFTKSVFIAAFFAISAEERRGDAAIWAINCGALHKGATRILHENQEPPSAFANVRSHFESWLTLSGKTMDMKWPIIFNSAVAEAVSRDLSDCAVFPVEPRLLNRRMQCQQTVFLAPTNVGVSFVDNLHAILEPGVDLDASPKPELLIDQNLNDMYSYDAVLKVMIPERTFPVFRRALREMNLSEATLFPDLEGLIRSLVPESREWGDPFNRTQ